MWFTSRRSVRIIVSHLTRMQPGFVCIAGIDSETGRHVRPELRGTRIGVEMLEPNGGPFNMAVEVDLGRAKPKPSPPEVEDCEIRASSASKLRDVPADEFWQLLQKVGQLKLVDVFGADLCRHGNTCILESATGRASLGCLIPGDAPLLEVCTEAYQGQPKKRIRCHVRDLDGEYFPAVTDFRLYHDDQQTPCSELIANLNRRMNEGAAAILSVGVTRAMSQGKHWLQVNNIHLQDDPTWRLWTMADHSSIEWTEATWNPVTGCSHISAGCAHCYAERMALRLQAAGMPKYRNGFKVTTHEKELLTPQSWRKPHDVFLCSMGDLFHEEVPPEFIRRVFNVMRACRHHRFQVLTKRSVRLKQLAPDLPWPENVWMGVTVEDGRVVSRIDDLRAVPAKVRFLSCEPLIADVGHLPLEGIHWVIVGGESGPGARPMKEDWVLSIKNQCGMSGAKFYFKQWGGVRKHLTGRELEGRTWDDMPVAADRPLTLQLSSSTTTSDS